MIVLQERTRRIQPERLSKSLRPRNLRPRLCPQILILIPFYGPVARRRAKPELRILNKKSPAAHKMHPLSQAKVQNRFMLKTCHHFHQPDRALFSHSPLKTAAVWTRHRPLHGTSRYHLVPAQSQRRASKTGTAYSTNLILTSALLATKAFSPTVHIQHTFLLCAAVKRFGASVILAASG